MSKIEDYAVQLYTTPSSGAFGTGDYEPAEVDIECVHAFVKGYNKAVSDLEPNWRDMAEIVKIANLLEDEWLHSTPWDGIRDWGFYQEVFKRFKDYKERKEK